MKRSKNQRAVWGMLLVALGMLLLAACGGATPDPTDAPATEAPPDATEAPGDAEISGEITVLEWAGYEIPDMWADFAAEGVSQCLHAIANSENWQARFQNEFLDVWRTFFINGFRSARENKTFGVNRKDFFTRSVPREQLAIDINFTYTPRNDLRILRTEIENGN